MFSFLFCGMGKWEIGFFVDARGYFSRVSAKFFCLFVFLFFFWCFCCFLGVFLCFLFFVFVFRALARIFFCFFFRRRHEQNREFPLWVKELALRRHFRPLNQKKTKHKPKRRGEKKKKRKRHGRSPHRRLAPRWRAGTCGII